MMRLRAIALAVLVGVGGVVWAAHEAQALDKVKVSIAALSYQLRTLSQRDRTRLFQGRRPRRRNRQCGRRRRDAGASFRADRVQHVGGLRLQRDPQGRAAQGHPDRGGPPHLSAVDHVRRPQDDRKPQRQDGRHPDARRHVRGLDAARAQVARHERRRCQLYAAGLRQLRPPCRGEDRVAAGGGAILPST